MAKTEAQDDIYIYIGRERERERESKHHGHARLDCYLSGLISLIFTQHEWLSRGGKASRRRALPQISRQG